MILPGVGRVAEPIEVPAAGVFLEPLCLKREVRGDSVPDLRQQVDAAEQHLEPRATARAGGVHSDPGLEALVVAVQRVADVAVGVDPDAVLEPPAADLQRLVLPVAIGKQLTPADRYRHRLEAAEPCFPPVLGDQLGVAPDVAVARASFEHRNQPKPAPAGDVD